MITDEMVEKAIQAAAIHSTTFNQFQAALEAVEPMLIAQGMLNAAWLAEERSDYSVSEVARIIRERARELDPK